MAGDHTVTHAAQAMRLLELGETDLEMARLTRQLDELPIKTELLHLRRKIRELESLREKAEAFVTAAQREVRRLEDEIAQIDDHIVAAKTKASSAASGHKEVQNLIREVDALGRQKDKKETELVEAMERVEAGEAKHFEIDALIEKAHEKEAQLAEQYRSVGGDLKRRIAQAEARRSSLASSLDARLLARYEAVRKAKHGIGVSRFEQGRCSVCRIDLPADKAQALQSGGPIGECPNCHRILICLEHAG